MKQTAFSMATPREHAACGVGFIAARDGIARHDHLDRALRALAAVEHRGAVAADGRSSDGAGVMTDIPWALIGHEPGSVALATLFFTPPDRVSHRLDRQQVLDVVARTFAVFDLDILQYREVPTHPHVLGEVARSSMPEIVQAIVARPRACRTEASFEVRLYHAKQTTRTRLRELIGSGAPEPVFFTSLSSRTTVYKALTRAQDLPSFYPDLLNPRYTTRFCLFHRRFSTNTRTSWDKAQPFRLLAHNGEINTIAGNRSWSYSREQALGLAPNELLTHRDVSDSGNLNEHVEALRVRSSIPQVEDVLAITMPVAGVRNEFYSFWGRAMEPWDGPALITWADGGAVGARLDRNGFRPARWAMTDDLFTLASEAGLFDLDPAAIVHQGTVPAGSGVKVELDSGEVYFRDPSVSRENLGARFDARLFDLPDVEERRRLGVDPKTTPRPRAGLFRLTREEFDKVLRPMAQTGKEPIGSMGDTARPALFSDLPRSLYDYFFQTFAQVTNPPLDYLREKSVTDLSTYLGKRPNIFAAKELLPQSPGLRLLTPVLGLDEMATIRQLCDDTPHNRPPAHLHLSAREVDICVDAGALERDGGAGLQAALSDIAEQTLDAAASGQHVVILSDRAATLERPPVPSLLALRAAVVALNKEGLRLECAILLDSGDIRTTHQFAAAVGFGATAVCPYLACQLTRELAEGDDAEADALERRYLDALEAGLLKIMSKMGISVVRSYQSAKLFTSLGLGQGLLDRLFPGLQSPLGGLEIPELAADLLRGRDATSQSEGDLLPSNYLFKEHPRGRKGEAHSMTAARSRLVHDLTTKREASRSASWKAHVDAGSLPEPVNVRQLLEVQPLGPALSVDEVEGRREITRRFGSGAMSFGAISAESQRDIFVAMREVGGRSNSGEGGENPWYFVDGTRATVKQVASGRFGVDAEYLVTGDEIEIKVAQGAKPGEGGQLMGVKVDEHIARARNAGVGVDLISPPPLHDIYSIEDLKQLIFELRAVHPTARIGVKLVSGVDIGTIAVGVAKAGADVIQISGGDGGTGAAPLSSMKHAGMPWELGLTEVHQSLVANGLRERVVLRVDGGLQTGFDLVVAAALGADEFGFGKLLLVAEGCIMARVCEKNRCPRGIATHDPKFKAKYQGSADAVVEVLDALADDVREQLARLGVRTVEELIGRCDALRPARAHAELMARRGIDLSRLLHGAPVAGAPHRAARHEGIGSLDERLLSEVLPAIERGEPVSGTFPVRTTDRAVLAPLSGALAQAAHRRRMASLAARPRTIDDPDRVCYLPEPGAAELRFEGSAGQGFACFLVRGLRVELIGEANDSVAKGMSGGEVSVRPHPHAGFVPEDNVLVGNCALYGATGGALYLRGRAGDRFGVRNSGAEAVVEGVGLHACEYMTGGRVAILGPIGDNAGAGMTGGTLYLRRSEARRANLEYLDVRDLDDVSSRELRRMLERHLATTGSSSATAVLGDWTRARNGFVVARPRRAASERAGPEALGPAPTADGTTTAVAR